MKLLMISGDRSVLQNKKGAFWYTLEEFSKYWDRVDVICPRCEISDIRHETSDIRSQVLSFKSQVFFKNVFFHPSPYPLLFQFYWIVKKGRELIHTYHHDIMSVHEYPPFYNGIGAEWLSRKMKIPYALEVHHIVGYPRASSLMELIGRWLSHLFLPHDCMGSSAVRCVNRNVADVLERWGTPREKLHVIPSFYLDHATLRADTDLPKQYDLVCSGRMVSNKGFENVLHAVSKVQKATLLLIGDGSDCLRLEKLARDLRITDRVTFAGWLPDQKSVYRALQSARIFLMNSRSEGGPRVALEAMALGLPIITTRVGVMPDVIRDGDNGLFTDGTPHDLVKKISKLLDYPALQDKFSYEARSIFKRFERKKLIAQYAEFLHNLARV